MRTLWSLTMGVLFLTASLASAALLFQAGTPPDYVRTAGVTGDPSAYPISMAWVGKITASAADRQFFQVGRDGAGAGAGIIWTCSSADRIDAYLHGALNAVSTVAIPEGVWVFVGASHSSSTNHRFFIYNYESRQIIVNEIVTTNLSGSPTTATNYNTIGAYDGSGTVSNGGFDGTVAWVAIYNRDFTGANGDFFKNIALLGPYIHGAPSLLYSFQEMTGTTTRNRTSSSNDGTLTNFQASPWASQGLPRLMAW